MITFRRLRNATFIADTQAFAMPDPDKRKGRNRRFFLFWLTQGSCSGPKIPGDKDQTAASAHPLTPGIRLLYQHENIYIVA
jgi:hypothetical protein